MIMKKVALFKILDKCKATTREALECAGMNIKKREFSCPLDVVWTPLPQNCPATRDCFSSGALSAYLIKRWNVKRNVFCMLNGRTNCEKEEFHCEIF
ncbi:hypothetical protein GCK72_007776 [Caenorhabditis remanei]|uniref:Uncharacterized protein n=1 Tax=Caenorhabditis remanei TaxID=31234 RepID=A0A6A5HNB3_CAERE|nr:hypothetical protein GCK72_007776 [Caenorhabditis remanei]KAF1767817.1 hypothetical protein GCK72_007776 [Caenorhabditis remanei]